MNPRPRPVNESAIATNRHVLHIVCRYGQFYTGAHNREPVASIFLMVAVVGFKKNLWLIVAALAGHGVFDFFHRLVIQNPGVPVWWPGFCLAFDVIASGFLTVLLIKRSNFSRTAVMLHR